MRSGRRSQDRTAGSRSIRDSSSYCSRQRRANCQRVNASATILPKAPRQNEITSTAANSSSARAGEQRRVAQENVSDAGDERDEHDARGGETAATLLQAVEGVLRVGERVIIERGDFELQGLAAAEPVDVFVARQIE